MSAAAVLQDAATGSPSLTVGAILGIATGGAIAVFVILTGVTMYIARFHDKRERAKDMEAQQAIYNGHETIGVNRLRSCRSDLRLSRRLSVNPFLPHAHSNVSNEWVDEDWIHGPRLARPKRSSSQRVLRRLSGLRDSWP